MGANLPIIFRTDSSRFGMIPRLRTSPPASATATAIVSAWTSNPTKRNLDMSDHSFRMRLCAAGFTSSQRNPRYCESPAGRSILTNTVSFDQQLQSEQLLFLGHVHLSQGQFMSFGIRALALRAAESLQAVTVL